MAHISDSRTRCPHILSQTYNKGDTIIKLEKIVFTESSAGPIGYHRGQKWILTPTSHRTKKPILDELKI